MALKASASVVAKDEYTLSFNDIINFVPGSGRGDANQGKYVHRNGRKVLIVFSKNPDPHDIKPNKTGKKTNRTGKTRIGMAMFDAKAGGLRLVTCGDGPDGTKNWKPYTGTISL